MELKDFVYTTLTDIVSGVTMANKRLKESDSFVPGSDLIQYRGEKMTKGAYDNKRKLHIVTEVNFDVAVTASEESKGEVKGGIKVLDLIVGGAATKDSNSNSNVSKIQFKIPLALPHSEIE